MIDVSRKPFKAIEFTIDGEVVRIEEGFNVRLVLEETGETFEGVVTKVAPKDVQIRQDDENFERVFEYEKLVAIEQI